MGNLSLNSKLFNSLIFKPFESKNIVFKGPSGTTMGNFISAYDIFNVDINGVVNMYIGNLDTSPLITFLSDGNDWLNLITEENVSNYVIPLNAIFQINSTSNLPVLLNLGGNASNYFQGQASIKKQNLGGGKIQLYKKFAPNTLQGLSLWLKADAGVTLAGSNVTAWADQSGNSRNFTKSIVDTGFPTYSNGAVLFTASDTYNDSNASILALPSSSLNFTTPYTLIVVVRAGANNSCVFSKSNDDSKRRKYQISVNGGFVYSLESKDYNDTSIGFDTGTGDDVNVKRLIVSQYSSNTSGLIRYNGAQVGTGSDDVGIDETNTASVFIGASPFAEGTGYNAEASTEMYVYEIIFYNRALSTDEIQKIENYLNQKYSIY
jgi:hypothetical protein